MSAVIFVDIATLASYVGAGALLTTPGRLNIPTDIRWALAILVSLSAVYELFNFMETAAMTNIVEPFEDLLGMMQPIAWGALLYAYEQSAARREGSQRENLLGAALHGGRLGAWEWHVETGHVEWFGLSEQIFGFAPGTFPNSVEAVRERVHPEDEQSMWDDVERSLQTDTPYESTYRIVLPSGEVRWVQATGEVHKEGGAKPVRMVGTVRDVTDEQNAVRERERLADIIETTTDFVGTASPNGQVLYLNPAARSLLDIPVDADVSEWVFRQLHPQWAVRMIEDQGIPAAIRDGVWSAESAVLALDGREIPVSQLIIAHRAADGHAAYVSTVIRDISERKRAEEELRESEERFRNLIEGSLQGIFIHRNFEPMFVNSTFAGILGYDDPEEILRMPSIEPIFAPEEMARMRRYNKARLAGDPDVPAVYEVEAVRRDGSRVYLQNTARRVNWRGQTAIQAASVDVTERREAEERLKSEKRFTDLIIDSLPGVFYLFDRQGRYLRWNRAMHTITGYSKEELTNLSPLDLVHERDRDHVAEQIKQVLEEGEASAEASLVAKDGSQHPHFFTGHRIMLDGNPCVVGMGIDIGDLKSTEAALRASKARYLALYEDNPSMYLTLDDRGTIRSINRYGAEQLGYGDGTLLGTTARSLYPESERDAFDRFLSECLEHPGSPQRWELPKLRADGSRLWVRETARAVSGTDGETVVLVVSEDASEARDLSERLAYEASHDGLTDLINRREFENRLQSTIEATRGKPDTHVLCYLDLDQFKVVNDTCGHMAGDELLRQLGGVLQKQIRQHDTVARLGGDEFALLIERCPIDRGVGVANKLRRAVEDFRFQWEDYSFKVGVSIGLVPIDASSPTAANVLALADSACYVAKDLGRNRVHVYDADDDAIARRTGEMQWVGRLNTALELDRFRLVRQNIASVQWPGRGEHFELLLRMEDEDGGLISPGTFLPAAERYNVMARIDRWVLDTALDWLAHEATALDRLYLCGVNLSGHSLTDDDFLAYAEERIRGSSVPAEKLCFEITETAAITNFAGAHRFITSLRELGCVFALDDFGSGLSSFGYLKTLPVDFLKIDGTFVRDIVDDPIDLAMVEAINRVGQVMGKWTIAECVESEEVLDLLQEIGVNFAQGFHIHYPEPLPGVFSKD